MRESYCCKWLRARSLNCQVDPFSQRESGPRDSQSQERLLCCLRNCCWDIHVRLKVGLCGRPIVCSCYDPVLLCVVRRGALFCTKVRVLYTLQQSGETGGEGAHSARRRPFGRCCCVDTSCLLCCSRSETFLCLQRDKTT